MNILVVGDSISSIGQCGLGSQIESHYVRQIESKNHIVTNVSVGGQSNQKILLKSCAEITKNHYDLVIIQWSSLFRLNLNKGDSIYEGNCNLTVYELAVEHKKFKPLWDIWNRNFLHPRIEILEWLSQIILLETFLKAKQLPYVFVKGFDNFFTDLNKKNWSLSSNEFKSTVLFLDSHLDSEVDNVYNEMIQLYQCIGADNWLNLFSDSWVDSAIDLAGDGQHPGPLSHTHYFNNLENYIKKLGLSF